MYQIYGTIVAPPAGLEPATSWLTVMRSANWAIEEYFVFFSLNTKDNDFSVVIFSIYSFRQLSTFPGSHPPSIIDVKELNFCVRYGNRWILLAIVTESICSANADHVTKQMNRSVLVQNARSECLPQAMRVTYRAQLGISSSSLFCYDLKHNFKLYFEN